MNKVYYNECGLIIRDSIISDVYSLKDRLKLEDIQEVWASHHASPEEALKFSITQSALSMTTEKDGVPVMVFGVTADDWMGDTGMIWFMSADLDRQTKIVFLRNSKKFIDLMLSFYPYLYNYVDIRNQESIKWLEFCGAIINEPEKYGADQKLFRRFHFERNKRMIEAPADKSLIRESIGSLESQIKQTPGALIGDNAVCPLKHTFVDGIYVREIFIPKGMLVVGKIHRHSHPNFLIKGDVSVLTEEGQRRIQGPCWMISPAGTKRVVYTHEDTVWTTVHATKETNLERIEEEIIAKTYEELHVEDKTIEAFVMEILK